jgi:hypothetical protein
MTTSRSRPRRMVRGRPRPSSHGRCHHPVTAAPTASPRHRRDQLPRRRERLAAALPVVGQTSAWPARRPRRRRSAAIVRLRAASTTGGDRHDLLTRAGGTTTRTGAGRAMLASRDRGGEVVHASLSTAGSPCSPRPRRRRRSCTACTTSCCRPAPSIRHDDPASPGGPARTVSIVASPRREPFPAASATSWSNRISRSARWDSADVIVRVRPVTPRSTDRCPEARYRRGDRLGQPPPGQGDVGRIRFRSGRCWSRRTGACSNGRSSARPLLGLTSTCFRDHSYPERRLRPRARPSNLERRGPTGASPRADGHGRAGPRAATHLIAPHPPAGPGARDSGREGQPPRRALRTASCRFSAISQPALAGRRRDPRRSLDRIDVQPSTPPRTRGWRWPTPPGLTGGRSLSAVSGRRTGKRPYRVRPHAAPDRAGPPADRGPALARSTTSGNRVGFYEDPNVLPDACFRRATALTPDAGRLPAASTQACRPASHVARPNRAIGSGRRSWGALA